jgi:hypothetical protein
MGNYNKKLNYKSPKSNLSMMRTFSMNHYGEHIFKISYFGKGIIKFTLKNVSNVASF